MGQSTYQKLKARVRAARVKMASDLPAPQKVGADPVPDEFISRMQRIHAEWHHKGYVDGLTESLRLFNVTKAEDPFTRLGTLGRALYTALADAKADAPTPHTQKAPEPAQEAPGELRQLFGHRIQWQGNAGTQNLQYRTVRRTGTGLHEFGKWVDYAPGDKIEPPAARPPMLHPDMPGYVAPCERKSEETSLPKKGPETCCPADHRTNPPSAPFKGWLDNAKSLRNSQPSLIAIEAARRLIPRLNQQSTWEIEFSPEHGLSLYERIVVPKIKSERSPNFVLGGDAKEAGNKIILILRNGNLIFTRRFGEK